MSKYKMNEATVHLLHATEEAMGKIAQERDAALSALAALHTVLKAADDLMTEALQLTVTVPEKMGDQVVRVRESVEAYQAAARSLLDSGDDDIRAQIPEWPGRNEQTVFVRRTVMPPFEAVGYRVRIAAAEALEPLCRAYGNESTLVDALRKALAAYDAAFDKRYGEERPAIEGKEE